MLHDDRCRDMNEMIIFEPHTDNSPDARTGLLSLILYYVFATVARHGFKMVLRSTAANTRDFTMVLFTEPSKHLCRRYMRSDECHSSYHC